jgi:zinc protease
VLALSGDFDPAEAEALLRRYFADISRARLTSRPIGPGKVPERTASRDTIVEDAHVELPALMYAWLIPPSSDPDHHALEMAANLLSDGESSRLYRLLVREKSVAVEIDCETDHNRGPDAFEIVAKLGGADMRPSRGSSMNRPPSSRERRPPRPR